MRKGEYTPAVEDWVRNTRTKYPSYRVPVRAVDLSRERGGRTEKLKVGSVIHRELLIAAAQAGVFLGLAGQHRAVLAGQSQASGANQMPPPDRSFLEPGPNNLNIPVIANRHAVRKSRWPRRESARSINHAEMDHR